MLGAHIIKVKPPTAFLEQAEAKAVYEKHRIDVSTLSARIAHVVQSCFDGRRIVVFSGGAAKTESEILDEVRELNKGGASGSIMGRNSFQRPREEALKLLDAVIKIYKGQDQAG
jgi:class I fructose-bisphosphate aldolase